MSSKRDEIVSGQLVNFVSRVKSLTFHSSSHLPGGKELGVE